jgi:predicted DNA-binding protein (UPF0251 family)
MNPGQEPTMWNNQNFFNADMGYAMRLVRTGNATIEQAAATCGVSLDTLQEMLAAAAGCPGLQLQEVESTRR